jgi:GNAT superfamily N-acetyltransferase
MLSRAYWADKRPSTVTKRAIQNSLVFGMYDGSRQVGMARVVTDFTIFAYLCDVFILEDYRGQGRGKWLLESILAHPELKNMRRWMLVTNDAHGLYQQFGFKLLEHTERWMEIFVPYSGEVPD